MLKAMCPVALQKTGICLGRVGAFTSWCEHIFYLVEVPEGSLIRVVSFWGSTRGFCAVTLPARKC